MREAAKELVQRAIEVANDFQRKRAQLTKERDQAKLIVAEKQASLDAASGAIERFNSFKPTLGTELQCPMCWIGRGANAPLVPQASTDDTDRFKCRQCHAEFSF